jgi:SNF2 family DNA or RNA helicase
VEFHIVLITLLNTMEIVDNKVLLLRVNDPARITAIIPKSKLIGDDEVAVHWGLEESQVLKNLGIKDVPSPIIGKYNFAGLYKPFKHQITTASFLTLHKRAFCFNEQGTGKTASIIWAADYLMKLGVIRRVLVVCPLSIMQSAWQDDLFKFAMHRSTDVAYGAPEKRKKIISSDASFVIINYDGVEIVADEIDKNDFDLIVIDEANAYKNVTTRRWKTMAQLANADRWLWMLTGTPASQSPEDAYGLAKLIAPSKAPKFFGSWRDKVMARVSQFRWVARPNADELVHELLQPAIRFTKEECLDLPEMTYETREIPLTKQQDKYYKQMKKQALMHAAGEEISGVNAAAVLNKLLQISAGAVYSDTGEVVEFDCSNRLSVLDEVLSEASSKKILVFVPFRHAINVVSDFLSDKGYSNEVISGDVTASKRTDIFRRFQSEPSPRALIIQPQAASHGVTLTAASTIIWFGPTTSLETYLQANSRAHRQGQRNAVTVVHLQGSPAEKRIYSLLQSKLDVHEKIISLYKDLTM